jgi:hypothetical protein
LIQPPSGLDVIDFVEPRPSEKKSSPQKVATVNTSVRSVLIATKPLETSRAKTFFDAPKVIGTTRVWSQSQVDELKRKRRDSKR